MRRDLRGIQMLEFQLARLFGAQITNQRGVGVDFVPINTQRVDQDVRDGLVDFFPGPRPLFNWRNSRPAGSSERIEEVEPCHAWSIANGAVGPKRGLSLIAPETGVVGFARIPSRRATILWSGTSGEVHYTIHFRRSLLRLRSDHFRAQSFSSQSQPSAWADDESQNRETPRPQSRSD